MERRTLGVNDEEGEELGGGEPDERAQERGPQRLLTSWNATRTSQGVSEHPRQERDAQVHA